MRENFSRSVDFVIRQEVRPGHEQEGDLHTTPGDPGGTTCFGFAQRYQKFDVATLLNNRHLAEQKYLELYWMPSSCDKLSWPIDLIHFDTAVNMGASEAGKLFVESKNNAESYMWKRLKAYWDRRRSLAFSDWIKRMINLHTEISL